MTLRSWTALAIRESRGSAGRLAFFAACLSVGVAAVVAVAGLSDALDSGIRSRARQLLAADIALESRRPIPSEVVDAVDALNGARRAEVRELPSMVSVPGGAEDSARASLLCEIKAVEGGYPFYGELELDPNRPLEALLASDAVAVAPELLTRLGVRVGDRLRLGSASFRIAGIAQSEPDRIGVSLTLGPRVFVSLEGLARSGLVGVGSRVEHRLLVRLADGSGPQEVRAAAAAIRAAIAQPEFIEVETYVEAQPTLRRALRRVERFLGLVALLSLLVGGIGVAQAVRAWLAGRFDAIAVLRALGARPREVFTLYLAQTVVLGFVGSAIGGLVGASVARWVPTFLRDLWTLEVVVGWQPTAMARGVGLGVGVAVLFALRPLLDVMRFPPVRVLRRDADPVPVRTDVAIAIATLLAVGVFTTAAVQSGSIGNGAWFTAGLAAATVVLAGGAWLAVRGVGLTPRDLGSFALRHGLAAISRPGAGTIGAVVALGLGVLTVLGMALVQDRLSAQIDADLPDDAPTTFLIDIQPHQWEGVRGVLEDAGARDVNSVEAVIGRLREVNGVPVADLVPEPGSSEDAGRRRWVLTREQRLSTLEELSEDNRIVEGALWSEPDRAEVSIEQEFARDLGVSVGSDLVFDVQGVPLPLYVSSIRTVEWERFSINFFLVVEPGVLDDAPRYRVATARLDASAEPTVQNELAAAFPNVTLLPLREILEKVVSIFEQVGLGVRILGGFTVLAGIAILGGSVSARAVRRAREVALYKTIGMTRAQVVLAFGTEYALIGLVAGVIGSVGAIALAWSVVRFGFEMEWAWRPETYVAAIAATVLLTVGAGLASSVRALAAKPLTVLREE